ncbi:MAG TPA: OsmC family protein [Steroidobacteraceae bacterium]|nr:OsmC family protein [Steroidobacteraceae bacterium]
MSDREHDYRVRLRWTGNRGSGTSSYRAYARDHEIDVAGKPPIPGSSDPAFRGDASRYNPEELLVAALSACHMLWYLHLCAAAAISVLEYRDEATGTVLEETDGGGRFREVTLHPVIRLAAGADVQRALQLHERAHALCFIARSVSFPVSCQPAVTGDVDVNG